MRSINIIPLGNAMKTQNVAPRFDLAHGIAIDWRQRARIAQVDRYWTGVGK